MAGLPQAVKDKASSVKEQMAWSNVKALLTIDKIIVFAMIALLWVFSTVPLFIYYSTQSGDGESQVSQPSSERFMHA